MLERTRDIYRLYARVCAPILASFYMVLMPHSFSQARSAVCRCWDGDMICAPVVRAFACVCANGGG